jgi:transcriptional regulator with AAA-type ATPase domain
MDMGTSWVLAPQGTKHASGLTCARWPRPDGYSHQSGLRAVVSCQQVPCRVDCPAVDWRDLRRPSRMSDAKTKELDDRGLAALEIRGARLLVLRGPDRGASAALDRDEVSVGSAPSSTLVLSDNTVSRHHLVIRPDRDAFLCRDLESTNGTRLGGHRIREAWLMPGDVLDLGATRLRLELLRQPVTLPLSPGDSFGRLLGASVAMKRLFALLQAVAVSDSTVALCGETGTGKDAAAESIHETSRRAAGPFVVVDCSAIPANLLESELFGYERGAFTGAVESRPGAFQEAHGGTLFLDEIGELPRELQAKLLRALENREVRPLGGKRPVKVDLRIISATNRDLRVDVNRGHFREDLYYRLHVVPVRIPPLRERMEDIPLLAEHFRAQLTREPHGRLPEGLVQELMAHAWPGNVRELRNRIEHALVVPSDLGEAVAGRELTYRESKERAVRAFELAFLTDLMARSDGNVSEAARRAGMDRVYLTTLLRRHGLHPSRDKA